MPTIQRQHHARPLRRLEVVAQGSGPNLLDQGGQARSLVPIHRHCRCPGGIESVPGSVCVHFCQPLRRSRGGMPPTALGGGAGLVRSA
jgi:hypothetical protein